ncbi:MAG TPA: hypothetical protein VFX15_12155 [Actinomycetes bacterium]|nr:hypothetical protein [Actinomycetes bacterium]
MSQDSNGGATGDPVDPVAFVDDVKQVESVVHTGRGGDEDVDHAAVLHAEQKAHAIAGAVYGTILATTVVASLGHDPDKLDRAIAIVFFTSLVFWAAHVYSLIVAGRMVARRQLTVTEVREIAAREWPMLQSCVPVLIPLVLGVTGIISRDNSADLAILVGIGALFFYGILLGIRERRGRMSIVWNALVIGSFGVLILLLKIVVH